MSHSEASSPPGDDRRLIIRSPQDVVDFVSTRGPATGRTKMLTTIALLSVFADGYDLGSLGLGISSLRAEFDLSAAQVGTVSALTAVGALVSSLLGGYISDRTGRFKLFVIVGVALVITPLGAAFAPNYETLAVFRFLMGVAIGLDIPVAFSFMAEFGRHATRGRSLNLWQPLASIATIVAALVTLAGYVALGDGDHLWRWAVGFGAVPMIIVVALRLKYAEESPGWAAKNQGLEAAARILRKSYGVRVDVAPDAEVHEPAAKTGRTIKVGALFAPRFRARTLLCSVITSAQSLQYYAVGFYTPVIAGLLFGADVLAVLLSTIVVNVVALAGGAIQPFVTHRLGLWKLAVIGFSIVAAMLVGLGLLGDVEGGALAYVAVGAVAVLLFGHTFGPGPVSKTMPTLSYPTEIRGMGTGWAETVGRIGTIVGLAIVPVMLDVLGQGTTLLVLALVPLAALVTLAIVRWDPLTEDVDTAPSRMPSGT